MLFTFESCTRGSRGLTESVLFCRNLRKRFGDLLAVDGVGFEIAAGETYGLLGPNGAGKTTTVSMICGLLDANNGEVVVAGRPVDTKSTDAKAAIGYVPQEIALYPDLTANENLRFFGRLYGLRGADLAQRVDEVLEVVALRERAGERVDHYSGGMKRRLNIAAGLLHSPKLLVLDEPTVGVDPQSRNAILENVEKLAAGGVAVLYTTHYMEEAERLCDRVGIMDHGRLLALDTVEGLLARHGGRSVVVVERAEGEARVETADPVAELTRALAGRDVLRVRVDRPDLEGVFLALTGRTLRDE